MYMHIHIDTGREKGRQGGRQEEKEQDQGREKGGRGREAGRVALEQWEGDKGRGGGVAYINQSNKI